MKLFNIKCKKSRKKPRFKKDKFPKNSAKNLILETVINKPNQVWVSDFTYISYQNKFMYLAISDFEYLFLRGFCSENFFCMLSVNLFLASLYCPFALSKYHKID